ncbi:unnamed protein product, partial [Prorocentrum cordatum]
PRPLPLGQASDADSAEAMTNTSVLVYVLVTGTMRHLSYGGEKKGKPAYKALFRRSEVRGRTGRDLLVCAKAPRETWLDGFAYLEDIAELENVAKRREQQQQAGEWALATAARQLGAGPADHFSPERRLSSAAQSLAACPRRGRPARRRSCCLPLPRP